MVAIYQLRKGGQAKIYVVDLLELLNELINCMKICNLSGSCKHLKNNCHYAIFTCIS